jgi:hypothetical protein
MKMVAESLSIRAQQYNMSVNEKLEYSEPFYAYTGASSNKSTSGEANSSASGIDGVSNNAFPDLIRVSAPNTRSKYIFLISDF